MRSLTLVTGWVLDSMRMFPQKQPPTGIFEVNLLFGSMSDGMIHCSVERVVCGCLYLVRAGWGCLQCLGRQDLNDSSHQVSYSEIPASGVFLVWKQPPGYQDSEALNFIGLIWVFKP